ncbi:FAD-binding and (Fe-S)-binding domain-containing protein [Abyssalbus ytuae]|uniref:FAD-binding protein n=1 Tax=Abyssalbus ytuae TaxID=2926907 RepID=A0A9E6ZMJ9_9FLAO|nr:FAD-binding and (Fe-S)-binding domain-containing protein [Abyssalbus ytuae]UOB17434.1 FAD-binding protein [Abyssalbus ytuae]
MIRKNILSKLESLIDGEVYTDDLYTSIYATDASVYRKKPDAVVFPKTKEDISRLIEFVSQHKIPLIPRTAGTSLAGQCVGEGIIVDVSRHFTNILEVNEEEQTVTVEPGVIRDELNLYLKPFGLFFGPNTSTSNRCMIGGMVGNNSSGTTSIKYGVTRDKVLEIEALLSDGSVAEFKSITADEFEEKTNLDNLEGDIYRALKAELLPKNVQKIIRDNFPKPEIHRRNTGYAIDEIIKFAPFDGRKKEFNMCKLLAGSEGTLAFTTKIKLKLDRLPPANNVMIAAHFNSVENACKAVIPIMEHDLYTCEMMDKIILDCTKNNKSQLPNRFFIEGDPAAVLMLELADDNNKELEKKRKALIKTLEKIKLSYAHPSLYGNEISQALELRKAGLGLLGNMVGDKKAVACIEDTAVSINDLAPFIDEFTALMEKYEQQAVYYAHAGAGELHLRPILDLKKSKDVELFRRITTDVASLVKKYGGSMSGEHGDGRVRSEFIELMIGRENYRIIRRIKEVFDPLYIFNPGKIVDAVPMDQDLRYRKDRKEPEIKTLMDFSDSLGILRVAEKCNGSGDCRKTHVTAEVMCPSYQVTKDEKDTTRARANALREFLTHSEKKNKFNHTELKQVFDLCLSCKGCSSECPSNVDVSSLKAEFLYQYQKVNGTSLRDKAFAYNTKLNVLSSRFSFITNTAFFHKTVKKFIDIAEDRQLPVASGFNFKKYIHSQQSKAVGNKGKVVLFIDEFTRYLDIQTGKDAIDLLLRLGYKVELFFGESGRTFISKGFLKQAKNLANKNIESLKKYVTAGTPVVGIEPSAILSFRDEYLRLGNNVEAAKNLAKNAFLIEEFLSWEIKNGEIDSSPFTTETRTIKFHGHCHQKALSNQKVTFDILNLPENYSVTIINSGCCGMAGSFGYEKEHYEVSIKAGSLKLFPAINKTDENTIIAANGTSCRHQIYDGTKRTAKHPVSILREALKN